MRRLLLVSLLAATLLWPRLAASEDGPRAELGVESRGLHRGTVRTEAAMRLTAGWRTEAWRAGVQRRQTFADDEARETRLHAAHAWQLPASFRLEASASHIRVTGVRGGAADRLSETGVELLWDLPGGLVPRAGYFRDWQVRADTWTAALDYSLPLPRLGAFLEVTGYAGWSSARDLAGRSAGPVRADAYGYCGLDLRLPYRVGESLTVILHSALAGTKGQSRLWSSAGAPGAVRGAWGLAVNLDF